MTHFIALSTILILCFAAAGASAQSAAPKPASPNAIREKTTPGTAPRTNLDQESGTLSDKLSESKGVIKPSGTVDPAIQKPTPQAGSMPVIKPGDVGGSTAK